MNDQVLSSLEIGVYHRQRVKITCQPLHAPQHQWPLPIVHELLLVLVDGWMIEHDTILSWNLI